MPPPTKHGLTKPHEPVFSTLVLPSYLAVVYRLMKKSRCAPLFILVRFIRGSVMNQKSSLHCIRNVVASASGGVSTTSPLFQLRQLQSTWETEFPMAGQALYYQSIKGGPSSVLAYASMRDPAVVDQRRTPSSLPCPITFYAITLFSSPLPYPVITLFVFFKHFFVEFGFFFRMSLACSKRSRLRSAPGISCKTNGRSRDALLACRCKHFGL